MTTLTLQPSPTFSKDTYITSSGTQSFNYGVSTVIITGNSPSTYKGLIQFDLSQIPPGAVINSATLSLDLVSAASLVTTESVEVHRALTEWSEGLVNGTTPTASGATWTRRDQPFVINWGSSTAGGLSGTDYSASAAATASVTGVGTYTWDLTSEVDAIVNGSVANRGWWLIQPSGDSKSFVSSDDSGRPTSWPKLTIDYTPGANDAIVLQPDATTGIETTIHGLGSQVTFNYGVSATFEIGNSSAWTKGLIKFDLSSLPAGLTIVSASLILHDTTTKSVSPSIGVYRSLVQWYEGIRNGAAPSGEDGSTWNLRNANGSVAWAGGVGGGSGSDYASTATDSQTVNTIGTFTWDVTADVQNFYSGAVTNHGWWLVTPNVSGTLCSFSSSDNSIGQNRPKLVIVYVLGGIRGVTAGTSTATGTLTTINPVLTLQPDESAGVDTALREFTPTFNFGIATVITAGWDTTSSKKRRSLIKFDLSSIPAGSIILGATLKLYCSNDVGGSAFTYSIYRSLVQWFEGNQNGAAPSGGSDGSTWNLRNANGSVAWGTAGGQSGTDYDSTATAATSVTTAGQFYNWDVSVDVQNFVAGLQTNLGWWLICNTESGAVSTNKDFSSSNAATAANRPILVVAYQLTLQGSTAGTSTVTGHLAGIGGVEGSAAGTSTASAQIITNFFSSGSVAGTSTASGTLTALGNLHGNSFGDSTSTAIIRASYHSEGSAAGTSFHVAHLKGVFRLQGATGGAGTAIAHIFTKGQIRGAAFGTSTATVAGYARAVSVAAVIGCNPVPLLYVTNGSTKTNGQLDILNFLNDRSGYFLVNYKPQIFQYKDGGYWSSSPQSNGRRLRGKVFENVIDVIEVAARAGSQDSLIDYQQDLIAFQEAASDYWASDHAFLPYYLVARAARETHIRYALIHMISCPELENPYTQPFFDDAVGATFTSLTIRIEHGIWTSTPPGRFDCVEVSGTREWTVSGWQIGS